AAVCVFPEREASQRCIPLACGEAKQRVLSRRRIEVRISSVGWRNDGLRQRHSHQPSKRSHHFRNVGKARPWRGELCEASSDSGSESVRFASLSSVPDICQFASIFHKLDILLLVIAVIDDQLSFEATRRAVVFTSI